MDPSFAEDAAGLRQAMEYYADQGWTDGLPVVPVTESYLAEFLAFSGRDPGDVLLAMPHLNRELTVRLAAINAALAAAGPSTSRWCWPRGSRWSPRGTSAGPSGSPPPGPPRS